MGKEIRLKFFFEMASHVGFVPDYRCTREWGEIIAGDRAKKGTSKGRGKLIGKEIVVRPVGKFG